MQINNYEELKNAIELYFLKKGKWRKKKLKNEIQAAIAKIEFARENIVLDLGQHENYISIFTKEDQAEIIYDIIEKVDINRHLLYEAHMLLFYASNISIRSILCFIDPSTVALLMREIEQTMEMIGCRPTDAMFPILRQKKKRKKERKRWKKLHKMCKKNLPKVNNY